MPAFQHVNWNSGPQMLLRRHVHMFFSFPKFYASLQLKIFNALLVDKLLALERIKCSSLMHERASTKRLGAGSGVESPPCR